MKKKSKYSNSISDNILMDCRPILGIHYLLPNKCWRKTPAPTQAWKEAGMDGWIDNNFV